MLRTTYEERLHVLARGTHRALKALGRTEDAAKVDLTPSRLHDARAVTLAGLGETVLELAEPLTVAPAPGQPAPGARYVTAALVQTVDDLWTSDGVAVGVTGGVRAARKGRMQGLPTKFTATEAIFADLDDLVVQFRGVSAAGGAFVEAWFNARRVADLGRRAARPTVAAPVPPVA